MTPDGRRQRRAVTAAERALRALEAGDAVRARAAAAEAYALDQVGAYHTLVDAVTLAATELDAGRALTAGSWAVLASGLGPGPLRAWAEERAAPTSP